MPKTILKYGDWITQRDMELMDICNSDYWCKRFKLQFPDGCKFTFINLKDFFQYHDKDWRFIKLISGDGLLNIEFNMHYGIKRLILNKGTLVQSGRFACEVRYGADDRRGKKHDHTKFFKRVNKFFKKYNK